MNDFNNCCFNCNLMDLNFCGSRYTWKNGRIQERLDWALSNFSWFNKHKEAHIEHLNWFKSDHRPILLNLHKNKLKTRCARRFRFLAAWVTEESFTDVVKNNWNIEES